MNIDTLEVILKITERCNMNCTYCYYFNGRNKDYENKPRYIHEDAIESIINFLRKSIEEYNIKIIQLDLHGGEPMLLKKNKFDEMMTLFHAELGHRVDFRIAMQTNGVLIDDEWLHLMHKHDVYTSISLDGSHKYNDTYRLDHKGNGTYDQTLRGLRKLQSAYGSKKYPKFLKFSPGIICVVNASFNGAEIYNHFTRDLDVNKIKFLLPDNTHDSYDKSEEEGYKRYMLAALDEWLSHGIGKVHVRTFDMALHGLAPELAGGFDETINYAAVTIRSDGEINPPDDLRNALPDYFDNKYNTGNTNLGEFIASDHFDYIDKDLKSIPDECLDCGFRNACKGGNAFNQPEHRYSKANGFKNKSIYCSIYKSIFLKLAKYIVENGYPWQRLERNLTRLSTHN